VDLPTCSEDSACDLISSIRAYFGKRRSGSGPVAGNRELPVTFFRYPAFSGYFGETGLINSLKNYLTAPFCWRIFACMTRSTGKGEKGLFWGWWFSGIWFWDVAGRIMGGRNYLSYTGSDWQKKPY
jgi:hypothetical protein